MRRAARRLFQPAQAWTRASASVRRVFRGRRGVLIDVCIYIICRYMEISFMDSSAAGLQRNILHCIGKTTLMALRKIRPGNAARILVKLESENPTGSMKDRVALAMIEAAEADGRLAPGGAVVEYTGGSTGVSLSLVCAVKGYPLHIVTSDAFAREKLEHMTILGAKRQILRS